MRRERRGKVEEEKRGYSKKIDERGKRENRRKETERGEETRGKDERETTAKEMRE